ncbi:hypothetical protein [Burkholderia pyrrocinia]|uniref:hypothetical protein n=1 Tax=Burkholderia pyrrocinia TaxID=60550 RepID=UPI001BCBE0A2|nr:hypothetical protein [Burkholderia pyrrocinia]QVN21127.1 hypothetical protein JYG32_31855 [Burkholderia pyrrocinia]
MTTASVVAWLGTPSAHAGWFSCDEKRLTIDADRYVEDQSPARRLADPGQLFGIGGDH